MKDHAGQEIIYPQSALRWTISPELGKIEKNQWVVEGREGAKGNITLTAGKKQLSLPVSIASKNFVSVADRYLDIPLTYSY